MDKKQLQVGYGILLIITGVGVFFKIPYVMPRMATINYFANAALVIKFSLYILGGLLVLAGVMKVFKTLNRTGDV